MLTFQFSIRSNCAYIVERDTFFWFPNVPVPETLADVDIVEIDVEGPCAISFTSLHSTVSMNCEVCGQDVCVFEQTWVCGFEHMDRQSE